VEPNVVSFSSVINAYAQAARPEEAERILREMHASRVEPNVVSFSSVINAYAQAARHDSALQTLDQIARLASEMDSRCCFPGSFVCCAFIKVCSKARPPLLERGREWFEEGLKRTRRPNDRKFLQQAMQRLEEINTQCECGGRGVRGVLSSGRNQSSGGGGRGRDYGGGRGRDYGGGRGRDYGGGGRGVGGFQSSGRNQSSGGGGRNYSGRG
jgi:pentatricopeptide repeat protein